MRRQEGSDALNALTTPTPTLRQLIICQAVEVAIQNGVTAEMPDHILFWAVVTAISGMCDDAAEYLWRLITEGGLMRLMGDVWRGLLAKERENG